jgi:nucleotide-binding universal stress UspA family protein
MLVDRPPISSLFQKIVVATDFSSYAMAAIRRAANLAIENSASIHLVHVIDRQQGGMSHEGVPFSLENHALEQLEASAVVLEACHIPYSLGVREGKLRESLVEVVREEEADLLVLSTHGSFRFDRAVSSSQAEKILRVMPCPVMTVGPGAWLTRDIAHDSRVLVFATDLSAASLRAAPFVDALAYSTKSEVLVLHVATDPKRSQPPVLLEALSRQHFRLVSVVHCASQVGELAETIASAALRSNADAILLGIRGEDLSRTPRGGLHLGLVYQILSQTAAPVISISEAVDVHTLRGTATLAGGREL